MDRPVPPPMTAMRGWKGKFRFMSASLSVAVQEAHVLIVHGQMPRERVCHGHAAVLTARAADGNVQRKAALLSILRNEKIDKAI